MTINDLKKKDLKFQHIFNLLSELDKQSKNIASLIGFTNKAFDVNFGNSEKLEVLNLVNQTKASDASINELVLAIFGLFKMVGLQLRFCASANRVSVYQTLVAKWLFKTIKKTQSYRKIIDEDARQKLKSMLELAVAINQQSIEQLKILCLSEIEILDAAQNPVSLDKKIDDMYNSIKREMKSRIKSTNAKGIVGCYAIIEIAKIIERVSDYSIYNHFTVKYVASGQDFIADLDNDM